MLQVALFKKNNNKGRNMEMAVHTGKSLVVALGFRNALFNGLNERHILVIVCL